MNSPLPFQSPGATLLQITGPYDKNELLSGIVGGTPRILQGTDPVGWAHDVWASWTTGTPLADTPSGGAPAGTVGTGPDTSWAHGATRVGVGVLAIVLIGIGVYWVMKA